MGSLRDNIKKILKESDDFGWVRDVSPIVPFGHTEEGETYKVHSVDGGMMLRSFIECDEFPPGLDEGFESSVTEIEDYFYGKTVTVMDKLVSSKEISDCENDEKVLNVKFAFDNDWIWWCYEGMITLTTTDEKYN